VGPSAVLEIPHTTIRKSNGMLGSVKVHGSDFEKNSTLYGVVCIP